MSDSQIEKLDMSGFVKPSIGYVSGQTTKGKSSLETSFFNRIMTETPTKVRQSKRAYKRISKGRRLAGRLTKLS